MANSVKERITTDLEKAKTEGNVRAERIRGIVKNAVSQAIAELKEGSGEIGHIARDAVAAVIENLGEKGKAAKEEVTASIEGVVEGITHSRQDAIAQRQAQMQELQTQIDVEAEQLETEIGGALATIEANEPETSSNWKSLLDSAINTVRERKEFELVERQYAKLKMQMAALDEYLETRYGDRYGEVKQRLETTRENAKIWYETAKTDAAKSGIDPIQQRQAELETRVGAFGTTVAQKEQQIKQRLKEIWQTVVKS